MTPLSTPPCLFEVSVVPLRKIDVFDRFPLGPKPEFFIFPLCNLDRPPLSSFSSEPFPLPIQAFARFTTFLPGFGIRAPPQFQCPSVLSSPRSPFRNRTMTTDRHWFSPSKTGPSPMFLYLPDSSLAIFVRVRRLAFFRSCFTIPTFLSTPSSVSFTLPVVIAI